MVLYWFLCFFYIYSFLGWSLEVAYAAVKQKRFINRGFLNGPVCPIYGFGVVMVIGLLEPLKGRLGILYLMSVILVTLIEGITGFVLDKIFHHKWWDYSERPLNIGGYVCLLFSLVWGIFCVFIVKVFQPILWRVTVHVPVLLGTIIILIGSITMFIDVWMTISGIMKFNRHLEAMDRIAHELRMISDRVGENIYEDVVRGMERESLLRQRYEELAQKRNAVAERLMKAFPGMQSRNQKEVFLELRERVRERVKEHKRNH